MSAEELRLPMPWGHIAAKTWGSKKDKRVLMVHGILDNSGTFDRLISLLPSGYYFVSIDLPGHGLSSHFPAGIPLNYFNYVLSIRRVLDYLQWENCIYIGHSLGGNLGTTFTAINPGRITKILCIDSVIPRPVSNAEIVPLIRGVHDYYSRNEEETAIASKLYTEEEIMYKLVNLRGSSLNIAAAKALMKRSVSKVGDKYKFNRDPRVNISFLPLLNDEQHFTILKQLEIPVSIILATATLTSQRDGELRKLFHRLSLENKFDIVTVEGNHDVHNNHPERVAPHVSRFLGSVKSSL